MTNNVVTTSPAAASSNNKVYVGMAYREQVVVYVRWAWMVSTMLRTTRSRVGAWKSSTLTSIFLGVDTALKEKLRDGMARPNGLEKAVGKSEMVLEDNGLWEIREATE